MALESKHIVRLFSRMLHLYGHRWHSVYGNALDAGRGNLTPSALQWQHDLRDYSPEQVAVGVQAVIDRRLEWPPGPIEFANLCDGIPSVAEIMDRDNDYGPVCTVIRRRLDWFTIEGMPSMKAVEFVKTNMERVLVSIRKDGTMAAIQEDRRAALAQAPREALA